MRPMFTAQESTEIRRPIAPVWGAIDDFAHYPSWMESCVALESRPAAVRAAGTPLYYRYAMPGSSGEMTGTIASYTPEQELSLRLEDARFEVVISFRIETTEYGTRVHHSIGIEPRFSMPRYMEALLHAGNRKQVGSNLTKLKRLVETTAEPPAIP